MSTRSINRRQTTRTLPHDTSGLDLQDALANLLVERDFYAVAIAECEAHGSGETSDLIWQQAKLEAAIKKLAPDEADTLEAEWAHRETALAHQPEHPNLECPPLLRHCRSPAQACRDPRSQGPRAQHHRRPSMTVPSTAAHHGSLPDLINEYVTTIKHCGTLLAHRTDQINQVNFGQLHDTVVKLEQRLADHSIAGQMALEVLARWQQGLLHRNPDTPANRCRTCHTLDVPSERLPPQYQVAIHFLANAT